MSIIPVRVGLFDYVVILAYLPVSICLSDYLFYLPIYLSVRSSICLSLWSPVCLSFILSVSIRIDAYMPSIANSLIQFSSGEIAILFTVFHFPGYWSQL